MIDEAERLVGPIGRNRESLMLDRVETVIWRAVQAVAGCARDESFDIGAES